MVDCVTMFFNESSKAFAPQFFPLLTIRTATRNSDFLSLGESSFYFSLSQGFSLLRLSSPSGVSLGLSVSFGFFVGLSLPVSFNFSLDLGSP